MHSRWLRSLAILVLCAATPTVASAKNSPDGHSENTAWIGVSVASSAAESDGGARGVRIDAVEPDGPAHRAGVQAGDLVTQINGRAVREPDAFIQAIRAQQAGKRIRLTIVREGRTKSLEVTADSRPRAASDAEELESPEGVMQLLERRSRPRLGVEVMDMSDDLAAYFDTKPGDGVLVTRVLPGSGAADAGIKAGDVLLRVDGNSIQDVEALHAALENRTAGDRVEVGLRRHGRAETATVEVGATDVALGALSMRPWTQRRAFRDGFSDAADVESLRRELRQLKRDLDELKRDLRDRR